jgi:hypothetical protein
MERHRVGCECMSDTLHVACFRASLKVVESGELQQDVRALILRWSTTGVTAISN